MRRIKRLLRSRKGATAIEYGLIAALIALPAGLGMSRLGDALGVTFNDVRDAVDNAS